MSDDHLMNYIEDNSADKFNNEQESKNIQNIGPNKKIKVDTIEMNSKWVNVELSELPYSKFYKDGAKLFIRSVMTRELQSFAVIDENNPYDVQVKLNELLKACTKIEYPDGTVGDYKDIMDGDRNTVIILLSKISAKKLKKLQVEKSCSCSMDEKQEIEFIPRNYVYLEENEKIAPFFDENEKVYKFPITINNNDLTVKLAPPTIGMSESMNLYIIYKGAKYNGKEIPTMSFIQCLPYLKCGEGVNEMGIEALEQEEYNFEKLTEDYFAFIYDAIQHIKFGIEKVRISCKNCGKELAVPYTFPDGPKSLFIVPNSFEQFIR